MDRNKSMKRAVSNILFIAIGTILLMFIIGKYCSEYIYFNTNVDLLEEGTFYEYVDKTMGFGGGIYNNTIFPIRIKEIIPIGERGMEYHTTVIAEWGFSEMEPESFPEYEQLEGKIMLPFTKYRNLAVLFKFTDGKIVNPSAFILKYSIFGIGLENIIINNYRSHGMK